MSDGIEWTWDEVERLIEDLKRDGYQPSGLKTNTAEPRPKKSVLLRVERKDTDNE